MSARRRQGIDRITWWGTFADRADETQYRLAHREADALQARAVISVSLIALLLLEITELGAGAYGLGLADIQLGDIVLLVGSLAAMAALGRITSPWARDWLVFAWALVLAFALVLLLVRTAPSPATILCGTLIALVTYYAFVPLPLWLQAIPPAAYTAVQIGVLLQSSPAGTPGLSSMIFALIASNWLGAVMSLRLQTWKRRQYLVMRKLTTSEERLRTIWTFSTEWYWEQDSAFRFTEMSRSSNDWEMRGSLLSVGKTRWELPITGVSESQWAEHRAALERHEPFNDFEYCRLSDKGQPEWWTTSGEPVFDAAGHFTGYRGVARNITRRKRAEHNLRLQHSTLARLARLASAAELAAAVAHELNQPLTAAGTFSRVAMDAAMEGHEDLPVAREAAGKAVEQIKRAAEVVRRLRTLIGSGRVETAPVGLCVTIRHVLELLRPEIEQSGILVQDRAGTDLPWIQADALQIELVLMNLVRNAIEALTAAGTPSGAVAIECGRDRPGFVEIRVRDNGPGFPMEPGEDALQAFASTKEEGLGLGLSLCRSIVEAHGGRFWIGNGDRGALVRFTLPEAQPPGN